METKPNVINEVNESNVINEANEVSEDNVTEIPGNNDANEEDLAIPKVASLSDDEILNVIVGKDGKVNEELMKKHKVPLSLKPLLEAGLQAKKTEVASALYEAVGGKENYKAMMDWASKELSPEDREQYNTLLRSNVKAASLAAKGIFAEYSKVSQSQPSVKLGNVGSQVNSAEGFATHGDFLAAQRDPRYKSDAGFREQCIKRVKNSTWFRK